MRFHLLIGLEVSDSAGYQRYRDASAPIMKRYGAEFHQDFHVSETLKSDHSKAINRVFVLSFPSRSARETFFADPEYVAIREKHFVPAVAKAHRLAEYEA